MLIASTEQRNLSNTAKKSCTYLTIEQASAIQKKSFKLLVQNIIALLEGACDNQDTRDELAAITKKLDVTNLQLISAKIELDKHKQEAKNTTIRIHNVPAAGEHEDVNKTVIGIFKDASIEFDETNIDVSIRPSKNGIRGTTVICRLRYSFDRIKLLKQRKNKMRDNGSFQRKHPDVFITEDLTPMRQHIAYKLRQSKDKIAKSWSIDGKIKCLKIGHADADKPITIDSPYDLRKIDWSTEQINEIINEHLLKTSRD